MIFIIFSVNVKIFYPLLDVDFLVLRSTIGLRTVWIILILDVKVPAFLIYKFHQYSSEKTSIFKNLKIEKRSCSEFWTKVPVRHQEN